MSFETRGLDRRGIQAFHSNEVWSVVAGEDMEPGTPVWINPADGKAYKADNTTDRPAHGFVSESTAEYLGLAVQDNHTAIMKAGERFDLKHYLTFTTDVSPVADVQKLIYLGANGTVTLTKPTTSTEIIQVIGRVLSRQNILLFVELSLPYETIA